MTEHCLLPHLRKVTDMILYQHQEIVRLEMDCLKDPSNYFLECNGAKCLKLKLFTRVNVI